MVERNKNVSDCHALYHDSAVPHVRFALRSADYVFPR